MSLHSFRTVKKKANFVRGVGGESSSAIGEIDLVPMINVVFLLLIFFMVVGVFRSPSDNSIDLPTTQVNAENQSQKIEPQVLINRQGEFLIDGQEVVRGSVLSALQSLTNKESLLIRADANAPANDIVFLLQLAPGAGFSSAGLQTIDQSLGVQR